MRAHRSALLLVCSLLPACATQTPALNAPAFAAMQRDCIDSASITLGPVALRFARFLMRFSGEHDPDSAAANKMLRGLRTIQVRSFQYATGHTYRQADLEALRAQFTAPVWRHMVQVRNRGPNEDVDIFCMLNNSKITGLVIIDAEAREFTWVNIVGTIDPDQIGMLRHGFISRDTRG